VDVELSVLGPVRAWRGPDELDLGPNQQRAILALLLVRANHLVTVNELVELLWERDPPTSAVNVIHKYIGAIRRLLEPDLEARSSGRWLTRQGAAYRLAADEATSDLIAFRRLESLQARLVLLLAATGQQALALAHYQVVRVRLGDEPGVDPGAELCAAHGQVLRQEVPSATASGPAETTAETAAETAAEPEPASLGTLSGAPSPVVPRFVGFPGAVAGLSLRALAQVARLEHGTCLP
jgi:DNA-binding SARP family transcriptional activator